MDRFLVLLLIAFQAICAQDFDFETVLDRNRDFVLKWNFDNESIDVEVSAKTTGWIAFGFSPNGGMDQSDVMFGFVENGTGRGNITDRFLVANRTFVQLQLDPQQDWTLLSAAKNETHTTLRARRKLETCDSLDRPISTDSMRLIYGLSNQPKIDYLKPARHQFRGSRSILFLDQSLATRKSGISTRPVSTLMWNVGVDGVVVPQGTSSMYHCKLMKVPEFAKKLHIVQVVPKIEDHNIDLVHHIEVFLCNEMITDKFTPKEFECVTQNASSPNAAAEAASMIGCTNLISVWAVGGSTFTFPEEAGYPVGPELRGRYVYIQMHYNNPAMQRRVDSSSLQFFLTDKLRKHDAGTLVLGTTSFDANMVIPPKTPSFMHFGLCDDSCTQANVPSDGINAFAGFLHSHLAGRKLRMRHIRNGIELPVIVEGTVTNLERRDGNALIHAFAPDNHYDFDYQEIRGLSPRRKVLQGDQILMECEYSTASTNTVVLGGMATYNEMCFGALLYYPKMDLNYCASDYDVRTVADALAMQDVLSMIEDVTQSGNFSNSNDSAAESDYKEYLAMLPVLEHLRARLGQYDWTNQKIQLLQEKYRTANLSSYCQHSTIDKKRIAIPQLPPAVVRSSSKCEVSTKKPSGNLVIEKLPVTDEKKAKVSTSSSERPVFWIFPLCAWTALRL